MEKRSVATTVVLVLMTVGLLSVPTHFSRSMVSAAPTLGGAPNSAHGPSLSQVAPAVPVPLTSFPRTVMIETFTGVWCIHCPSESQALYQIDHNTTRNVVDIAELHSCAFAPGTGPCLENYVPPDGTTGTRGTFYNVCGYPDVFFDGNDGPKQPSGLDKYCGASNSEPQMQSEYEQAIANASRIPGNVSITESASVSHGNVTAQAFVTSAISGSYNAVTYLLEYIGKRNQTNGYGPHDVAWAVRSTLHNHPITLVAGGTTEFNATGGLNSTWNDLNLSVVSLVQENSTRIVENANMAPVTTLTTAIAASRTTLASGTSSGITVRVANSSTAAPISGAAIQLTSSGGGSFSPASGVTAADGSFAATFTAPSVPSTTTILITAQVTASGYTSGTGTVALVVTPLAPPSAATGLAIAPGNQQVSLNWTKPSSGGAGLTYHVYRSTLQAGAYSAVGVSTVTGFVDAGLVGGLVYWYKVSAQSSVGFSPNTTAISATGVTATPQGLPPNAGWWISIDSANFSSATNASLALYLPSGIFAYQFGSESYAYLGSGAAGPLSVSGAPLSITVSFSPRYAHLVGTVAPSDATVTLNGASIPVDHGSFGGYWQAGTYTLNVSTPGYRVYSAPVTLTPGNLTNVTVQLQPLPSGPITTSSGGLTNTELTAIIVAAVIGLAALLGVLLVMSQKGRRQKPPRPGGKGAKTPSPSSRKEP